MNAYLKTLWNEHQTALANGSPTPLEVAVVTTGLGAAPGLSTLCVMLVALMGNPELAIRWSAELSPSLQGIAVLYLIAWVALATYVIPRRGQLSPNGRNGLMSFADVLSFGRDTFFVTFLLAPLPLLVWSAFAALSPGGAGSEAALWLAGTALPLTTVWAWSWLRLPYLRQRFTKLF